MSAIQPDRSLAAPGLRETADIWWDSGLDPVVVWDRSGRRFHLADPGGATPWLELADLREVDGSVPAPLVVATALAEGLAACDFPPTASGVSADRAAATLRAGGLHLG